MRLLFKSWTFGFALGLALVSGATAGVIVGPVAHRGTGLRQPSAAVPKAPVARGPRVGAAALHTDPDQVPALVDQKVTLSLPGRLPAGTFLVGADATSLSPAPELYHGTWQKTGCTETDENHIDRSHPLPGDGHGWPLSTKDCIYLAAFGIGPARAAHSIDAGGIWVRSLAISNGESTVLWQIVDSPGYLYTYNASICDRCGIYDVRNRIAADTGLAVDHISIGATHTHAGPDLYGVYPLRSVFYRPGLEPTFEACACARRGSGRAGASSRRLSASKPNHARTATTVRDTSGRQWFLRQYYEDLMGLTANAQEAAR